MALSAFRSVLTTNNPRQMMDNVLYRQRHYLSLVDEALTCTHKFSKSTCLPPPIRSWQEIVFEHWAEIRSTMQSYHRLRNPRYTRDLFHDPANILVRRGVFEPSYTCPSFLPPLCFHNERYRSAIGIELLKNATFVFCDERYEFDWFDSFVTSFTTPEIPGYVHIRSLAFQGCIYHAHQCRLLSRCIALENLTFIIDVERLFQDNDYPTPLNTAREMLPQGVWTQVLSSPTLRRVDLVQSESWGARWIGKEVNESTATRFNEIFRRLAQTMKRQLVEKGRPGVKIVLRFSNYAWGQMDCEPDSGHDNIVVEM